MRINVNHLIARLVTPAFVVMFAAPAMAQDSAADCADIEDDRARLACFDRVVSNAAEDADASGQEPRAERPSDVGDSARAGNSARSRSTESPRAAADRNQSTAGGAPRDRRAPAEPESAEDRFGMEKKMLELGGDEMSSTAVGQFDFWNKGQRVELENGQVWEITNSTNLYHKTSNPRVTIEKGLFSSFYMHIDGVSKSLKVRRID